MFRVFIIKIDWLFYDWIKTNQIREFKKKKNSYWINELFIGFLWEKYVSYKVKRLDSKIYEIKINSKLDRICDDGHFDWIILNTDNEFFVLH